MTFKTPTHGTTRAIMFRASLQGVCIRHGICFNKTVALPSAKMCIQSLLLARLLLGESPNRKLGCSALYPGLMGFCYSPGKWSEKRNSSNHIPRRNSLKSKKSRDTLLTRAFAVNGEATCRQSSKAKQEIPLLRSYNIMAEGLI